MVIAFSTFLNTYKKTYASTPPGDINGDYHVNIIDLRLLINQFNTKGILQDILLDGIINIFDNNIILKNYGQESTADVNYNFLVWSDTQAGSSNPDGNNKLAKISNEAKVLNPEFTIFNGDLCSSGFSTSCVDAWKTGLNGNNNNGMSNKTFTVRGNHDTSNTAGWQNYFNFEDLASTIGARNFSYLAEDLSYSFDFGKNRFILLDVTGCGNLINLNQINWANSKLSEAEELGQSNAFLFFHGPLYYVDSHTDCSLSSNAVTMMDMLDTHDIRIIIFNGHEHIKTYTHFGPDNNRISNLSHNIEQIVAGGAGSGELYDCRTGRSEYCGSYQGYVNVEVLTNQIKIYFYQEGLSNPVKSFVF